ncbi:hypothetical protein VTP01DRAFT_4631 [Rhizomucor pusillus]|uniref:uncharacterized protein n=1 Tax=Rhizomucor pusillus TaxID=4840 RepID=UPI003742BC73
MKIDVTFSLGISRSIKNNQSFYEDGQDHVVEYGRPKPMDYLVDENTYALETMSPHMQYLCNMPRASDHEAVAIQIDKPKDADVDMREATVKRGYTLYSYQDRMFEKVLSASAAAKQLGIHRRKDGRPHIVTEEHKKIILKNLKDLRTRRALYEFVRMQCKLILKKSSVPTCEREQRGQDPRTS